MELNDLGWNESLAEHFRPFEDQGRSPARVIREHTHIYAVAGAHGEVLAEVSGKFTYDTRRRSDFPAVGDWVAIQLSPQQDKATIHAVLPRKSAFVRKQAGGKTEEQVVAANIDTAFVVGGLDGDFNPNRIERYVTAVWESGANPVIVLNKADLCADIVARVAAVEAIAFAVPVLPVSATRNQGMDLVYRHINTGKTAVFLGSSGVGKSTIINSLLGDSRQQVQTVREDDSRGRHTTTYRELISLPGGGLVIDTPGMRELGLWADEDALKRTFEDVEALAAQCRFSDCEHGSEPGCAVKAALEDGSLDPGHWRNYLKLKRELRYLAGRRDVKTRLAEKQKWKRSTMDQRRMKEERGW